MEVDLARWSAEEVAARLEELGVLPQSTISRIRAYKIDGRVLGELDADGWSHLGVHSAVAQACVRVMLKAESKRVRTSAAQDRCMGRTPVINAFMEIFNSDHPPPLSGIKAALETLAVIGALLLTIVMAVPYVG